MIFGKSEYILYELAKKSFYFYFRLDIAAVINPIIKRTIKINIAPTATYPVESPLEIYEGIMNRNASTADNIGPYKNPLFEIDATKPMKPPIRRIGGNPAKKGGRGSG